jgi:hypothetical protein
MRPSVRIDHGRLSRVLSLVALVAGLFGHTVSKADHFSGASITYAWQSHPTLTNLYKVNLDLYLDCAGFPITPQSLYFSNACGVTFTVNNLQPALVGGVQEVSQLCPSQTENSSCQGGTLPSFRKYRFEVTLNLSPCTSGPWKIEWSICCRNTMVNLENVPGTYAVATVQHQAGVTDRSPVFVDSGIPYVCIGEPVSYNPGATDPDGNLMSFALVPARFSSSLPPIPNPVTYSSGFSGTSPFQGINIVAGTGQLTFTPLLTGRYVVVIEVTTFNSFGEVIGKVMRDLMFVVIACDDTPPISSNITNQTPGLEVGPNSVGVCQGQSFCVEMIFSDIVPSTQVSVTSNALALLPGCTFTVTGTNPAVARLCWTGVAAALPVNVFIQGDDGACPIPNINSRSILVGDCLSPLPITLLELKATPHSDHVLVEWATASERDNELFTVERSTDGVNFSAIGSLPGAGDSQSTLHYSLSDRQPLPGLSYYRLRQTDDDGTSTLSDVVIASRNTLGRTTATKLEDGSWWLVSADEPLEWEVLDLIGRTVEQGAAESGKGLLLDLSGQPGGMYLLVLRTLNGHVMSLRLPGASAYGTSVQAAQVP